MNIIYFPPPPECIELLPIFPYLINTDVSWEPGMSLGHQCDIEDTLCSVVVRCCRTRSGTPWPLRRRSSTKYQRFLSPNWKLYCPWYILNSKGTLCSIFSPQHSQSQWWCLSLLEPVGRSSSHLAILGLDLLFSRPGLRKRWCTCAGQCRLRNTGEEGRLPWKKRIKVFVKRVIGRSGSQKTARDVPTATWG